MWDIIDVCILIEMVKWRLNFCVVGKDEGILNIQ